MRGYVADLIEKRWRVKHVDLYNVTVFVVIIANLVVLVVVIVVVIVAVAAIQCCRRASFAVVIVDVARSPSLFLLKVNLPIILLF